MNRNKTICTLFALFCVLVLTFSLAATAFADGDPIAVVNKLSDFIFGLIRAVGIILLGFGVLQLGLSLKSHDPSQRANGMMTIAGGIVITFTKEILSLITGVRTQREEGEQALLPAPRIGGEPWEPIGYLKTC